VIYDGDVTEESNLNRLVGATTADARAETPKLHLAKMAIYGLQPHAKVRGVEANQFAAALLMPAFIFEELLGESPFDIEDEDSLEEWAGEFNVSKAALQYRLRNL
jgi:hypothetical protein